MTEVATSTTAPVAAAAPTSVAGTTPASAAPTAAAFPSLLAAALGAVPGGVGERTTGEAGALVAVPPADAAVPPGAGDTVEAAVATTDGTSSTPGAAELAALVAVVPPPPPEDGAPPAPPAAAADADAVVPVPATHAPAAAVAAAVADTPEVAPAVVAAPTAAPASVAAAVAAGPTPPGRTERRSGPAAAVGVEAPTPTTAAETPVAPAGSGSATAPTAAAPAPAAAPETASLHGRMLSRVLDALDVLQNAPPPRRLTVDIPDADGLRLHVALRGAEVHVSVAAGGTPSELPGWTRDLSAALEARGFTLGDAGAGRDERRGQRPTDEPEPVDRRRTDPAPARPRTDDGLRL